MEFVVAGEGQEHSESGAQREEDLCRRIDPNLSSRCQLENVLAKSRDFHTPDRITHISIFERRKIGREVILDALARTGKKNATD